MKPTAITLPPAQRAILEVLAQPGMELHDTIWLGFCTLPRPLVHPSTALALVRRGWIQSSRTRLSARTLMADGVHVDTYRPVYSITDAGRAALKEGES